MTQEIDGIIAYHHAVGAPGVVTDINTPGAHTLGGLHYKAGLPSIPYRGQWCQDHSAGGLGRAVDFGFKPVGKPRSPQLLAVFEAFVPQRHRLQELLYSGPGVTHNVYQGRWVPIDEVEDAVRKAHENHVHVAVNKGVILSRGVRPKATAVPVEPKVTPPTQGDDDMPKWASEYRTPDGRGVAQVYPDGAVKCFGTAQFRGSMFDLEPDEKRSFGLDKTNPVGAASIRPVDPNDPAAGYIVGADNGDEYAFTVEMHEKIQRRQRR